MTAYMYMQTPMHPPIHAITYPGMQSTTCNGYTVTVCRRWHMQHRRKPGHHFCTCLLPPKELIALKVPVVGHKHPMWSAHRLQIPSLPLFCFWHRPGAYLLTRILACFLVSAVTRFGGRNERRGQMLHVAGDPYCGCYRWGPLVRVAFSRRGDAGCCKPAVTCRARYASLLVLHSFEGRFSGSTS